MAPLAAMLAAAAITIAPTAHQHHHHRPEKVVVAESYILAGGRIDISPPTRLDVLMAGTDHVEVLFCEDMGGEPILYPHNWSYRPLRDRMVCEGIDY